MARSSGEVEFEFLDDGSDAGNFVVTAKVVPMLTTLLAKGSAEEAMHLYEGCDATVAAELIAQTRTMSSASLKTLGQMFAMARDFASAAKVFEIGKKYAEAAGAFEQAGDYASAAKCFLQGGDRGKAAAAYERAGMPEAALEQYQGLGPSDAMAECMVRQHLYWDAARVYAQLKNVRGEVEALRLVPITSPNRVTAVKRLADLMEQHGHLQQAAQVLVETVQQVPAAQGDPELLAALIRRLELMGRFEHAEKVRGFARKALPSGLPPSQPAFTPPAAAPAPFAAAPAPHAEPLAAVPRPPPSAPPPPSRPSAPRPSASDPFSNLVDPFGGAAPAPAPLGAPPRQAGAPSTLPVNDGYAHLKAIPIFGELALPDMKDLFRISDPISYAPGFVIIEQGVEGHGLIVVLEGQLQVVKVDGAKTVPLATLGPSSYVGELSLVDEAPTSARVVAHGAVRALVISKQRFQQYLYTHEQAAGRIFKVFTRTLAERLRQANKRTS